MGNLTMFGKTYDTVGSSDSNLMLRTRGDIKIQWGGKFIDLIKDGKINASSDIKIEKIDNSDKIYKDGIYLVESEENLEIWLSIKGTKINLSNSSTNYVSFMSKLNANAELKHQALQNIGFIYNSLNEAKQIGITSGIIYVEDVQKLYIVKEGALVEFKLESDLEAKEILTIGSIIINGKNNLINFNKDFKILNGSDIICEYSDNLLLIQKDLVFESGMRSYSQHFEEGASGYGYLLYCENDNSFLEVDNLLVRNSFTDLSNNVERIDYDLLYNKAQKNLLIPEKQYYIQDFQNEWEIGSDIYHPIIVTAKTSSVLYTSAVFLDNQEWQLEYDLTYCVQINDDYKTKGRITKLTDEYNNTCNFDFKHLKFYLPNHLNKHEGFYLFSRHLTTKELEIKNNYLEEFPGNVSDIELYKDLSLSGRVYNNTINIERIKIYSPYIKDYILINDELKPTENNIITTYNLDRCSQVIFIRELSDSDLTYEEGNQFENIDTSERKTLLLTMSENDIANNEELSEKLEQQELGLVIHDNYINNINGEFIFRYNMYNNTITGTLHQLSKQYRLIYDENLETTVIEETNKWKRITADGTELALNYQDSKIRGLLINTVINGDVYSLRTNEGVHIHNCQFKNIQGLDLKYINGIFENNIFNDVVYDLTLNLPWKNNIFNKEVTGKCHIPVIANVFNEDYSLEHGEYTKSNIDSAKGIIENCTFNGPLYNLQLSETAKITNSTFNEFRNVKVDKIINKCEFNELVNDLVIEGNLDSSIFYAPLYGFYTDKYISKIHGNIISSTFHKEIKGLECNDIIKSQFYDTIIRFKIIDSIIRSVFNGKIENLEVNAINQSQFENILNPEEEEFIKWVGTINNSTFHADITNKSRFDNLNAITIYKECNESELINCSNVQIIGSIIISKLSNCINVVFNKNINNSQCSAVDSSFLNLNGITFTQELNTLTIHNDLTKEILDASNEKEITVLYTSNVVKDGYVLSNKLYIRTSGGFMHGMIMMWGLPDDVPEGWAVCNGENGTPNLVGAFIKGKANGGPEVNDSSHLTSIEDNTITIKEENLPKHSHPHKAHTHSSEEHQHTVETISTDTINKFALSEEGLSLNISLNTIYSSSESINIEEATSEEDEKTWTNSAIKIEPYSYSMIYIMKL